LVEQFDLLEFGESFRITLCLEKFWLPSPVKMRGNGKLQPWMCIPVDAEDDLGHERGWQLLPPLAKNTYFYVLMGMNERF
jgi:hypothetical protein